MVADISDVRYSLLHVAHFLPIAMKDEAGTEGRLERAGKEVLSRILPSCGGRPGRRIGWCSRELHYIEVGWLVDAGAATGVAREVCCGVARGRSREACGDRHRDVG